MIDKRTDSVYNFSQKRTKKVAAKKRKFVNDLFSEKRETWSAGYRRYILECKPVCFKRFKHTNRYFGRYINIVHKVK